MESTTRQEAERIIGKLKVAIRLLGPTNREIERRLGYTPASGGRQPAGEEGRSPWEGRELNSPGTSMAPWCHC